MHERKDDDMTEYDKIAAIFRQAGYSTQTNLDGTGFFGSLEWAAEEYATVTGYLGRVTVKIGKESYTYKIEEVTNWEAIARGSVSEDLTKAMAYNLSEALETEYLRRLADDLDKPREVATEYLANGAPWFATQWDYYSKRAMVHVEYDEDAREFRVYVHKQPLDPIEGLPFRDALDGGRYYDSVDFNSWVEMAAEYVRELVVGLREA